MNEKRVAKELFNIAKLLVALSEEDEIANALRDNLSGTPRKVTKRSIMPILKNQLGKVNKRKFDQVWDDLVDEGYLIEIGGGFFKWERI